MKAFLGSSITALILSFCLLVDRIKYHVYNRRSKPDRRERSKYLRLIHTLESLLQTLSDQQIVAGIALLLTVNAQACGISAFHYNIVCTMLLLSAVTHLNTLVSISDFIFKGKLVATNRLIAVITQLVLSGIVLSARQTKSFPSNPNALGVLPAACFENMDAMKGLGFGDFADFTSNVTGIGTNRTYNASQIVDNIQNATSSKTGLGEYITLGAFTAIALVFLIIEMISAHWFESDKPHWSSIIISGTSLAASAVIVTIAQIRYQKLRSGMEVDAWFDRGNQEEWTYSQIVPLLLLGSGSITVLKAATGRFRPLSPSLRYCETGQVLTSHQKVSLVIKDGDT